MVAHFTPEKPIVTAQWLKSHLTAPDVRVLDCTSYHADGAAHRAAGLRRPSHSRRALLRHRRHRRHRQPLPPHAAAAGEVFLARATAGPWRWPSRDLLRPERLHRVGARLVDVPRDGPRRRRRARRRLRGVARSGRRHRGPAAAFPRGPAFHRTPAPRSGARHRSGETGSREARRRWSMRDRLRASRERSKSRGPACARATCPAPTTSPIPRS